MPCATMSCRGRRAPEFVGDGRCMRFARRLAMTEHRVVGHDAWVDERRKHLVKEKELTRLRDQLSRERRELPWELVEKCYKFEGERGVQTLSEMFDGRSQLVVYHAMFNPETAGPNTTWTVDAGCPYCSFWMDNFNGITVHLQPPRHHDGRRLACSLSSDRRLQEANGLGLPVAFFGRQRLQLRLPRLVHRGRTGRREGRLQLRPEPLFDVGRAGYQRLPEGRRRPRLPHLLDVLARARHAERRLPLHGPGAKGSRRRRLGPRMASRSGSTPAGHQVPRGASQRVVCPVTSET